MKRRDAIALLGATALGTGAAAWPLAGLAQQKLPVIGFLSSASISGPVPTPFNKGLSQRGLIPGQNVIIETRQAGGRYERLPALAAELVRLPVNIIVAAGGLVSARAAMAATKTIPVLFIAGFDPVKLGLVASFNRPGGNATGVSLYSTELLAKRLELFRELVPRISHIALLVNADNVVFEIEIEDMEAVASAAGLALQVVCKPPSLPLSGRGPIRCLSAPTHSLLSADVQSSRLRHNTGCPRPTLGSNMSRRVA